jgi:hypothetical protein
MRPPRCGRADCGPSGRSWRRGWVPRVLTHRYRLTETGGALQRTGWVVFVLLLLYSGWVLIIGVAFLAYAD